MSLDPTFDRPSPELSFKSERCLVPIYDNRGDIIGNVPVTFSCANTEGFNYEVTDVVYGDLLNEKPEYIDVVQAIQEAVGLQSTISFVGKFSHDGNLV